MFRLMSVTSLSQLINLLEEGIGEDDGEEEGFMETAHPGNLDVNEARFWIAELRKEIEDGPAIPVSVIPEGAHRGGVE